MQENRNKEGVALKIRQHNIGDLELMHTWAFRQHQEHQHETTKFLSKIDSLTVAN